MRIKYQSHTLDKQKNEMMIYPGLIFAKIYAAPLQTLAEKMTNTIYRAAKVCSSAAYILAKIHSFIHPSVYLMYENENL